FTLVGWDSDPTDISYEDYWKYYAEYLWGTEQDWDAAKLELRLDKKGLAADQAGDRPVTEGTSAGTWEEGDFTLKLKQDSSKISGSHQAVALGGNRIDGDLDDDSVHATVETNGVIKGSIVSTFGLTQKFTIVPIDEYLVFKVTDSSGEGESFIPGLAI